ncbi:hypothetical protein PRUB_b1155 [Pseudoalteromonas rubra]|uniref:Uncharacterized protein n=1 Tax=Pseudoalteromonas rubra TaxID=43658 RepID=A0A8T0C1Q9_9GAMM|nr:hypothetical protein [Pseudoalteromonas rubra]KAF7781816.1 hypothetical protein PRUB_b1155 [Pseudoalteromonas rubra]
MPDTHSDVVAYRSCKGALHFFRTGVQSGELRAAAAWKTQACYGEWLKWSDDERRTVSHMQGTQRALL